MEKVLLVNRGKCNNLGDQAIDRAFTGFLKRNFKVKVFSEDYTSKAKSVDKIRKEKGSWLIRLKKCVKLFLPLDIIWVLRNYSRIAASIHGHKPDLILIGGGQLLLSNRFAVASFIWVYLAKKNNAQVVFSNIGVGEKFSVLHKLLIGYAVKNCDGINVRDEKSKQRIIDLFGPVFQITVSADIVFTEYKGAIGKPEIHRRKTLLGIPDIRVYTEYNAPISREEYYEKWLQYLSGISVILSECKLIYTTSEDYNECIHFSNYIYNRYNIVISIAQYSDINEFQDLLEGAVKVVSGRMHALILGLNSGCAVKAFPISEKIISFIEMTSAEGCLPHLKDVSEKSTGNFLSKYLKYE